MHAAKKAAAKPKKTVVKKKSTKTKTKTTTARKTSQSIKKQQKQIMSPVKVVHIKAPDLSKDFDEQRRVLNSF